MHENDEAITLALKQAMTPERWQHIEKLFMPRWNASQANARHFWRKPVQVRKPCARK